MLPTHLQLVCTLCLLCLLHKSADGTCNNFEHPAAGIVFMVPWLGWLNKEKDKQFLVSTISGCHFKQSLYLLLYYCRLGHASSKVDWLNVLLLGSICFLWG